MLNTTQNVCDHIFCSPQRGELYIYLLIILSKYFQIFDIEDFVYLIAWLFIIQIFIIDNLLSSRKCTPNNTFPRYQWNNLQPFEPTSLNSNQSSADRLLSTNNSRRVKYPNFHNLSHAKSAIRKEEIQSCVLIVSKCIAIPVLKNGSIRRIIALTAIVFWKKRSWWAAWDFTVKLRM